MRTKKAKELLGPDFSRRHLRLLGNGERMWIRQPISRAGCERLIRSLYKQMVLPLVVIDAHTETEKNPDYTLSVEHIKRWESAHGSIPPESFVAMRTDWSKRWPNNAAMANKDASGVAHYPGWTLAALKYLYEDRKITASGHETTDTDPGIATTKNDFSLETYILRSNHYQIELLTNLDQVPEVGALVIVSFPKPKGGSGFPARVFAICP